jgi:hypothetical protein
MRYDSTKILTDPKRYYDTTAYPKFEARETDIYLISRTGDRLDNLAQQYYQDVTLWWVIARVNNVGKGTFQLEPGKQIRIPYPISYIDVTNALRQAEETK